MPTQDTRHLPRAPLPGKRCYLRQGDVSHRLGQHYPAFVAHIGSCAAPNSSCRFRIPLRRQVFAGCCEPLLQDGASRRYLHNPRVGAWTRTPPLPPGASTRFFPGGIGLTQVPTRSARGSIPAMQLQQGIRFRGCSHSFMFRLPHSLGPPIAPTAERGTPQGSRAVYTTQWTNGYPLELWHRYVHESGNLHGRTPTCWIVALSAATWDQRIMRAKRHGAISRFFLKWRLTCCPGFPPVSRVSMALRRVCVELSYHRRTA
jgi:hypothetical protein